MLALSIRRFLRCFLCLFQGSVDVLSATAETLRNLSNGQPLVPHCPDSGKFLVVAWSPTMLARVLGCLDARCLQEIVISPVKTTVPLYEQIFDHELFIAGTIDTGFIDLHMNSDGQLSSE